MSNTQDPRADARDDDSPRSDEGPRSVEAPAAAADGYPQAILARQGGLLQGAVGMWLAAGFCAVVAVVLTVKAWRAPGPAIAVTFEHGYGLEPGDRVRLRGIDVGEVESVTMTTDLSQVEVDIRLTKEASALARQGTQFWIQRPQLSLASVRGLDTLVGPKYIGVQPGSVDGPKCRKFVGVESPRQFSDVSSIGITVRFREGFGLAVGVPVRFRGVQVGEVVEVELDEELGHVLVHAELRRDAERLARAGSHFWVERPQLGVAQVRGLDTLIGGPYLSASPSASDGETQWVFEGLDGPPAAGDSVGGLEVQLESAARQGLKAGSPVLYRGVAIGKVVRVGLASDGTSVLTRVYIQSAYRQLVRDNSRFWSNSGLGVQIGLIKGLQLDAESLETIASGGVAMATPDEAGRAVATGHRFTLANKADDAWLQWRPPIPVGQALLPENADAPVPVRGSLRWKRRRFGIQREQQREAWMHALHGRRLLCPLAGDVPAGMTLEFNGQSMRIDSKDVHRYGDLAVIHDIPPARQQDVWLAKQLRPPLVPEDCVLLAGPDSLPVSAGRIKVATDAAWPSWKVDISIELTSDWHGASVVSQQDGALIGVLLWDDGRAVILPLPPEWEG